MERLPVIQAISGTFLAPTIIVLALKDSNCPYNHPELVGNSTSLPEKGSQEHKEIWQRNVREIQGCLMVASLLSVVVGFSGVIGTLMKYIGPLTLAPTLVLISLSLMNIAAVKANTHWYICFMTLFLMLIFSQYLRHVSVPMPGLKEKVQIFELISFLLAMVVAWIICLILTAAGVFTSDKTKWGYSARTDSQISVLAEAKWLYFPYPGQYGTPTVSLAGTVGLMAGVIVCAIESVGSYYATARLCGVCAPPSSAVSRGICIEGITSLLSGAWGCCGGTASYCHNVACISISRVGSRIVSYIAGGLMMILACFGKFGALFSTIPDPVMGGIFYVIFGMIGGVGVSNLQYVDLNSSRNLFVFGVSLILGLSLPQWVEQHRGSIKTGSSELDNLIYVLGGTSMFVGGLLAFFLDNTIPGTPEERGLTLWRKADESEQTKSVSVYNIPFIQPWLNRIPFFRYIPICPGSFVDKKSLKPGLANDVELNGETGYRELNETLEQ